MPSSDRVLKAGRPAASPTSPGAPGPIAPAQLPAPGWGPAPGQPPPAGSRLLGAGGGPARATGAPALVAPRARLDSRPEPQLTAELERAIREAERRGHEAGRIRAEAELASAIQAAGALALVLEDAAPRQAPVIAALVAELAVAVAARVLDAEVSLDPALLTSALERAMEGVNTSPEVRVLLHPAAVDRVREAWVASHGIAFAGKRWTFEPDPTLPIGGCVVRHDHGFVDAGLEAQLAEVSAAMDKVLPLVGRSGREAAA